MREGEDALRRTAKLEALAARRFDGLVVVLEDIGGQYNCGAALRSCEAFGVTEVWLVHNGIEEGTSLRPEIERHEAFDVDSRKFRESSASASRWVSTRTFLSTAEAVRALQAQDYTQVAVVPAAPLRTDSPCEAPPRQELGRVRPASASRALRGDESDSESVPGVSSATHLESLPRATGVVVSFNQRMGFGFIRLDQQDHTYTSSRPCPAVSLPLSPALMHARSDELQRTVEAVAHKQDIIHPLIRSLSPPTSPSLFPSPPPLSRPFFLSLSLSLSTNTHIVPAQGTVEVFAHKREVIRSGDDGTPRAAGLRKGERVEFLLKRNEGNEG